MLPARGRVGMSSAHRRRASAARFDRLRREHVAGRVVPVADRPVARLLGLAHLDLDRAGEGLLLERCSAVHTFGMRFAIDVVFLGPGWAVLRVERSVGPRRLLRERGAAAVLELPSRTGPGGGAGARGVDGGVRDSRTGRHD